MKTTVILILSALALALGVCPTPDDCDVPFQHDPNSINYRALASYTVALGDTVYHQLTACDPDDDNAGFSYELLSAPQGASISPQNELQWLSLAIGVYYIDIRVTDAPVAGTALTDEGTIVVQVLPKNRPPVLEGGCSQ